jgi:glycosyltransferase involved in cell wall biosynthesis
MLTHSYYEEDARVRREAEALVAAGRAVDVVALRRPGLPAQDTVAGVAVHRLPVQRHQGSGIVSYLLEYAAFFWRSAFTAARLHRRRRYGLAQVHTLPDPLIFAVAPLRGTGVPLVLDLHEAMPEFFRSRFPGASHSAVYRALTMAERVSVAFAGRALTVNDALAERLAHLGVPPSKVAVILNSPSGALFNPDRYPARSFMADGALRLVYAGALTPLYQVETVIEAMALLRDGCPDAPPTSWPVSLDVYGRGDALGSLRAAAQACGLLDRVTFHGRIALDEVPGRLAAADAGLAPTRRDAYTDLSLSTKVFECAAMGKPVLASRLPTVERYFGEDTVYYFEPGDAASLAAAVRRMVDDPERRAEAVREAGKRVDELSWERESARYVALVDALAGPLARD